MDHSNKEDDQNQNPFPHEEEGENNIRHDQRDEQATTTTGTTTTTKTTTTTTTRTGETTITKLEQQQQQNKERNKQKVKLFSYMNKRSTATKKFSLSWLITKLFGLYCIASFIIIWMISLLSPIFFFISMRYEYYSIATFIVVVTLLAYCPWNKGSFCHSAKQFYFQYHPHYYNEFTIEFEDSLPLPSSSTTTTTTTTTKTQKQQEEEEEEEEPKKQRNTFYAIHPHGAFCIGWAQLFVSPLLEHVKFCFAPVLFASPFFRLFTRITGNPGSASRTHMMSYMKQNLDIALPPGGFEEATLTSLHHDRVYISKRTGFMKLCLQQKGTYQVRPVYVFGERKLYWNLQGMFPQRLQLNQYGIPSIYIFGNWLFPLLPKNDPNHGNLYIVVGKPIVLPHIDHPTKEDVQYWHNKYVAALTKLFEEHKEKAYGREAAKTAKLEIW